MLNKALVALKSLRAGRGFEITPSMKVAREDFRALVDPLAVWLDQMTTEDPVGWIPMHDLWWYYNAAAAEARRARLSDLAFSRAFKRLRPRIQEGLRDTNDKRGARGWLGIRFRYQNGT